MTKFNRRSNLMVEPLSVRTDHYPMAMENIHEGELILSGDEKDVMATEAIKAKGIKEVAQVIGFVIIGFWLVSAVGFILASIFGGRSRAVRIENLRKDISYFTISSSSSKPKATKISRAGLVKALSDQNGMITRLMADCVNEGSLWTATNKIVQRGFWVWREKMDVLKATIEIDKLYSARDEKVFVNRAMKLADEINGSAGAVKGELHDLARELIKAGFKVESRAYLRAKYDHLDDIRDEGAALMQLYDAFIQFAGEEFTVDRLSDKGDFEIAALMDKIGSEIKQYDTETTNAEKSIKDIERIKVDKPLVDEFLKSTPEIKRANDILVANHRLLALASRIRAACATASLRTEEAMLTAIKGTLKEEYKKKAAGPAIGKESIDGGIAQFNSLRGDTPMSIGERILSENTVAFSTLLNIGTIMIREAGIQAELGGDQSNKFKDEDVVRLLAARIQNRLKV